jgi:hypothetical protein
MSIRKRGSWAPAIFSLALASVASAAPKPADKPSSLPAPLGIPQPGPATKDPYQPTPILPGGMILPLYPPGSSKLDNKRVHLTEVYSLSQSAPGRVNNITVIHNPSIEIHTVDGGANTGTTIILAAGGGHKSLNVGGEAADLVPFFFNYGINTVILRNRLRSDGYEPRTDGVSDALTAIRLVRTHAAALRLDPNRIGIMGFSAGGELASAAALEFESYDRNEAASSGAAPVSSRPDFVALVYPGPTPFSRETAPAIPAAVPPSFIATPGSGDRVHALWAQDYALAMLKAQVPNLELHIYGHGRHPGEPLEDGSRMASGIADRRGLPFGSWQFRFIDWLRDLGLMKQK